MTNSVISIQTASASAQLHVNKLENGGRLFTLTPDSVLFCTTLYIADVTGKCVCKRISDEEKILIRMCIRLSVVEGI